MDGVFGSRPLGLCGNYHPPSTIHHPPSTIHHPPSTIHHPPSTIHHPPSTIHNGVRTASCPIPPNAIKTVPP
ncbi:MAG: hypothetical protein EXS05_09990 [Planctomycetaceae bacterium]|nr:hypothetical protein [Planctomycetaceae bacterium]